RAKAHVKIDTGMGRLGYLCVGDEKDEAGAIRDIEASARLPGLEVEGIFTHFAAADEPGSAFTVEQFGRFMRICGILSGDGLHIPIRHCANSAAIIRHPRTHLDMVRPGIMLYAMPRRLGAAEGEWAAGGAGNAAGAGAGFAAGAGAAACAGAELAQDAGAGNDAGAGARVAAGSGIAEGACAAGWVGNGTGAGNAIGEVAAGGDGEVAGAWTAENAGAGAGFAAGAGAAGCAGAELAQGAGAGARFRHVMSLKARIALIKRVGSGFSVSYGREYTARGGELIATLPIGYADGLDRRLSCGVGCALVGGRRAPIVGRICMDQCMIDVTGIDSARVGAEAVLFGCQLGAAITLDELSEKLGGINYERTCAVSRRVPRVYIKSGAIAACKNYLA
ncbi:MAG: alanine racemase, partial [Clostridiales bacterium]|nr:alanine racemase [Clostridiales bacterium]